MLHSSPAPAASNYPSRPRGADRARPVASAAPSLRFGSLEPPAEVERLTHPLERLMDSPRALKVLGVAVPLVALAAWGCAAIVCTES